MTTKRAKPFAANNASRKQLESEGWTVTTVEQNIVAGEIRFKRDAYGFGDLLACSPSKGIALVQVTGGPNRSNFNARVAKIKAEPRAGIWLASGGKILVHSWEGKGSKRELREVWIQDASICVRCDGKGETVGPLGVRYNCTNCGGTGRIA